MVPGSRFLVGVGLGNLCEGLFLACHVKCYEGAYFTVVPGGCECCGWWSGRIADVKKDRKLRIISFLKTEKKFKFSSSPNIFLNFVCTYLK
jgi:hypothetical protein